MQSIMRVTIVIFVSVVLLRFFVIDSFIVRGDSMAPTILSGDYVLINKFAYRFDNEPQRGDLMVLAAPSTQQKHIIKRIIALPGERIVIENGAVRIKESRDQNGEVLQEEYLALPNTPAIGITYINLDPQEYFVLGDNRQISIDSRVLGPINKWEIKGKVFLAFQLSGFKLKKF